MREEDVKKVRELAKNVAKILDMDTVGDNTRLPKMRSALADIRTVQDYLQACAGVSLSSSEAYNLLSELGMVSS